MSPAVRPTDLGRGRRPSPRSTAKPAGTAPSVAAGSPLMPSQPRSTRPRRRRSSATRRATSAGTAQPASVRSGEGHADPPQVPVAVDQRPAVGVLGHGVVGLDQPDEDGVARLDVGAGGVDRGLDHGRGVAAGPGADGDGLVAGPGRGHVERRRRVAGAGHGDGGQAGHGVDPLDDGLAWRPDGQVTTTVDAPATSCSLVRISPSERATTPEPRRVWRPTVAVTSTTAGATPVAMAVAERTAVVAGPVGPATSRSTHRGGEGAEGGQRDDGGGRPGQPGQQADGDEDPAAPRSAPGARSGSAEDAAAAAAARATSDGWRQSRSSGGSGPGTRRRRPSRDDPLDHHRSCPDGTGGGDGGREHGCAGYRRPRRGGRGPAEARSGRSPVDLATTSRSLAPAPPVAHTMGRCRPGSLPPPPPRSRSRPWRRRRPTGRHLGRHHRRPARRRRPRPLGHHPRRGRRGHLQRHGARPRPRPRRRDRPHLRGLRGGRRRPPGRGRGRRAPAAGPTSAGSPPCTAPAASRWARAPWSSSWRAPHRGAAFAAAPHCIDTLKATVPLWKKETWAGGEEWGTDARLIEASPGTPADVALRLPPRPRRHHRAGVALPLGPRPPAHEHALGHRAVPAGDAGPVARRPDPQAPPVRVRRDQPVPTRRRTGPSDPWPATSPSTSGPPTPWSTRAARASCSTSRRSSP